MAELVDGMVKQLLAVWDKLEPAALGGDIDGVGLGSEVGRMAAAAGSLSVTPASIQLLSPDANSGEFGEAEAEQRERKKERSTAVGKGRDSARGRQCRTIDRRIVVRLLTGRDEARWALTKHADGRCQMRQPLRGL